MLASRNANVTARKSSPLATQGRSAVLKPSVQHVLPQTQLQRGGVVARAENGPRGDSNFLSGFLLGGVVFGTLGFVFAPQISKALLGEDQRIKLPRFLEDDAPKDPETTKQDLIEKIAQLNASIDDVAAQLKVKEAEPVKADASA